MIEKSTNQYGSLVSKAQAPENEYKTTSWSLVNKEGHYVGLICVSGRGLITLISGEGYELDNEEKL